MNTDRTLPLRTSTVSRVFPCLSVAFIRGAILSGAVRFRRFAVAAGLVYLTSGPAASVQGQGQQPPPTSQKPVFTSTVDVVSVDVTVVDKYGKPVEDLGRNDFILTVDGQPRKIASAQFVAMHRDALPSAGVALPASSLPDFSTNTVQEGKLIAIVIDRGNIAPV